MNNWIKALWIFLIGLVVMISLVIVCTAGTNNIETNIWIQGVEYKPKPYLTVQDKSNIVALCDKFIKELEDSKKELKEKSK